MIPDMRSLSKEQMAYLATLQVFARGAESQCMEVEEKLRLAEAKVVRLSRITQRLMHKTKAQHRQLLSFTGKEVSVVKPYVQAHSGLL